MFARCIYSVLFCWAIWSGVICIHGGEQVDSNPPSVKNEESENSITTVSTSTPTKQCSALPNYLAENNIVRKSCEQTTPDSTCQLQCKPGYQHSNEDDQQLITCDNGIWSDIEKCFAIRCGQYFYNDGKSNTKVCDHSTLNSKCSVTCADTFKFEGEENFVTCLKHSEESATWSQLNGKCVEKTCSATYTTQSGVTCTKSNKIGSTCTLRCGHGSYVEGKNPRVCRADGSSVTWDASAEPYCIAIRCNPYSYNDGKSTTRVCGYYTLNSKCSVTCADTFKFEGGDNSVTCVKQSEKSATWSLLKGSCVEKTCSATYRRRGVTCTNSNKLGSRCTLSCSRYDSYVEGKNPRICRAYGSDVTWDASAEPNCKVIRCDQYSYNDGKSTKRCRNSTLYSKCSVTCADTFKFEGGKNSVTCDKQSETSATWSQLNGECVEITCEKIIIPVPDSGQIKPILGSCTNTSGSYCWLKCDKGYEFIDGETSKWMRCEVDTNKKVAAWYPTISSIGSCQLKIVTHGSCKYWISNSKADNKDDASQKCKELLGPTSVLAMPTISSLVKLIYDKSVKIYGPDHEYIIGVSKGENDKWYWDSKDSGFRTSPNGQCAIIHQSKISVNTSCQNNFICEKTTKLLNEICSPDPCKNGNCEAYGCSYKCICENNFYGYHCESGPITIKFENQTYHAAANQQALIKVDVKKNVVGKLSLSLYQNGEKIMASESSNSQYHHVVKNVDKNIYMSASAKLQSTSGNFTVYACAKIIPFGKTTSEEVTITTDQCDAENLTVSWNKLNSTAQLSYTLYVDKIKRYVSTPDETSHTLSGLKPDTFYTIKVVPNIKGCKRELELFDEHKGRTASSLAGPPEFVSLGIAERKCKINWNSTHLNGVTGYKVRIRETVRSHEPISDDTQQYKNLPENNSASSEYIFMTNPNSKYQVEIGTMPIEGCEDKVPIAWSNKTIGCSSDTLPPDVVNLPTILPSILYITIRPNQVDERNGQISCYFIVVKMLNSSEQQNSSKPITDVSLLELDKNRTINVGDHFVSVALNRSQMHKNIILGSGEESCCDMNGVIDNCNDNTTSTRKRRAIKNTAIHAKNLKLNPDAKYSHYVLVSTPSLDGGESTLTASDYSPAWSVEREKTQANNITLAIVVPILIILLLAGFIGGFFLYRRKQSQKSSDENQVEKIMMRRNNRNDQVGEPIEVDRPRENPDEVIERVLSNRHMILLSDLYETMANKRANEDMLFLQELKTDVPDAIKACTLTKEFGQMPANFPKNRYRNIVPYDRTRVVLKKQSGDEFSDYVNATFIDGYNFPSKFIATQGPKPNTVNDFWRMIWEHQSCIIAMLTRLEEKRKKKCEQYWPDDEDQASIYGGISVSLLETTCYGDYVRRKFEVTKDGEIREVLQYQYIAWPDHGIPNTTSGIMRFHKSVVSSQPRSAGPIVVHCSAGVGRTGTFIALDILHEQTHETEEINICLIVGKMRTRRPEMVQTLEQYIYIHKLVLELYQFRETDVDVSGFNAVYKDLQSTDGEDRKIDQEFAMLDYFLPLDTDQNTGLKSSNKALNRDCSIVPYDHNAAFIQMNPTDKNIPYYNASDIACYHTEEKFIAAQTPTKGSTELFWRTVCDNNVTMIVSICKRGDPDDYAFWPKKNSIREYDLLTVKTVEEKRSMGCVERKFLLTHNDKNVTVRQIYYGEWAENGISASPGTILEIIANIERHHQTHQYGGSKTTIVHCSDGSGRTGAFCAISNMIERLKNENKVDVFRTVKDLRDQRPLMVRNVDQYEFCYQAVTEFLQSFDLYGNFQ